MDWIYQSDDPLLQTIAACFLIFIAIIVLTRIVGLRSFAKFTAYDFAFTVAIGSIISSTLTSSTTIAQGVTAIAGLLLLTFIFSTLQRKVTFIKNLISNAPLLLMDGEKMLDENLKHARIDKGQLIAKLREANVLNYSQVAAVVLESTGAISVLHKSDDDEEFNTDLLQGVRRTP
ncbi:MAG: DUF421 domain-containing protein [Nonlabens sp.]|uniref:DUF421 domain-containing protein n=1 Tax=Nonlabens sp. TaxID=1888209 RepID=UPI003EF794BD